MTLTAPPTLARPTPAEPQIASSCVLSLAIKIKSFVLIVAPCPTVALLASSIVESVVWISPKILTSSWSKLIYFESKRKLFLEAFKLSWIPSIRFVLFSLSDKALFISLSRALPILITKILVLPATPAAAPETAFALIILMTSVVAETRNALFCEFPFITTFSPIKLCVVFLIIITLTAAPTPTAPAETLPAKASNVSLSFVWTLTLFAFTFAFAKIPADMLFLRITTVTLPATPTRPPLAPVA